MNPLQLLATGFLLAGTVPTYSWTIYLGTYTNASRPDGAKGIYQLELNPDTGELTPPVLAVAVDSPAFLALAPSGKFLYAVNESTVRVSAFARDSRTGALTLLNQQPVGGSGPCHLAVDATGRVLITANYSGGSVSVFPLSPDGRLGERSDLIAFTGSGPNLKRQKKPHAHGVTLSVDNHLVFIPDLGTDKIWCFGLDVEKAKLNPLDPASVPVTPGAGPRHLALSPDHRHAYVVNELDNTVALLDLQNTGLAVRPNASTTTLPTDFTGTNTTAEIVVHPSGHFVYASNRGHNSIAVFQRDPGTGVLTAKGHALLEGREPRSFAISPDGRWLLVGNQTIQTLQLFQIEAKTGSLTPHGKSIPAPTPVCVLFVPTGL